MISNNSRVPIKSDAVKNKDVEVSCWNCFVPESLDDDPEPITLKKIRNKNREKFKLYPFVVSEISKPKTVPLSHKVSTNYTIGKKLEQKIIKDAGKSSDILQQISDKKIEFGHTPTISSTIPDILEPIVDNNFDVGTNELKPSLEIKRPLLNKNSTIKQDNNTFVKQDLTVIQPQINLTYGGVSGLKFKDSSVGQKTSDQKKCTSVLNENLVCPMGRENLDKIVSYEEAATISTSYDLNISEISGTDSSISKIIEQTSFIQNLPKMFNKSEALIISDIQIGDSDIEVSDISNWYAEAPKKVPESTICYITKEPTQISKKLAKVASEVSSKDSCDDVFMLSKSIEENDKEVEKESTIYNRIDKDYTKNDSNVATEIKPDDICENDPIISDNNKNENAGNEAEPTELNVNCTYFSEISNKPSTSEIQIGSDSSYDESSYLSMSTPEIILEQEVKFIPELIWIAKKDDNSQILSHKERISLESEMKIKSEITSNFQSIDRPETCDVKMMKYSDVKEILPLKEKNIICNTEELPKYSCDILHDEKLEEQCLYSKLNLEAEVLSNENRNQNLENAVHVIKPISQTDISSDLKISDKYETINELEATCDNCEIRSDLLFDVTSQAEVKITETKLATAKGDNFFNSNLESEKKHEESPKIPSRTATKEEDIEHIIKGIQNISLEHKVGSVTTNIPESKNIRSSEENLNEIQSNVDLNVLPSCSTPLPEKKRKAIFNSSLPVLTPDYRRKILKLSKSLSLDSKPSPIGIKPNKFLRWNTLGTPTRIPVLRDEVYSSDSLSPGHATLPRRSSSPLPNDRDTLDRSRTSLNRSGLQTRSESMVSVYSGAGEGMRGGVAVSGAIQFSLLYNYRLGALEVGVKKCKDLAAVDVKRNRSDPYVKVYLLPDKSKGGKRKTKVKKNTLNPAFEETLSFVQPLASLSARTLWLSVWHADMFGRNDFLGEVTLPLADVVFDDPAPKWYKLHERTEQFDEQQGSRGDLIVGLKFEVQESGAARGKGTLHVLVKEAKNLVANKPNGLADVFCKSYLLPERGRLAKQKTGVVRRSLSPRWEHTFTYRGLRLHELGARALELSLWDRDRLASNEFMGAVRLSLGTGTYMGANVNWMDSVGKEVTLWQTMMQRPNFWVEGSLPLRPQLNN